MSDGGTLTLDLFLDIIIDSVLEGLKVTSQRVAQLFILDKSALSF